MIVSRKSAQFIQIQLKRSSAIILLEFWSRLSNFAKFHPIIFILTEFQTNQILLILESLPEPSNWNNTVILINSSIKLSGLRSNCTNLVRLIVLIPFWLINFWSNCSHLIRQIKFLTSFSNFKQFAKNMIKLFQLFQTVYKYFVQVSPSFDK